MGVTGCIYGERVEYYTKKYSEHIAQVLDEFNCEMTGPYYQCPSPFGRALESAAYYEWFVNQSFKGSHNIKHFIANPQSGYIINLQYADIMRCSSLEEAVRICAKDLEDSVTSGFFQKYYQEKYADMLLNTNDIL